MTSFMPQTAVNLQPWAGSSVHLFYNYLYCPANNAHNAYYGFEDFAERLLAIKATYDPNRRIPLHFSGEKN
jgi:hypothetical protein